MVPKGHRVPAHLARRFHQVCLGVLTEITARHDLTPVQFAILTLLEDAPGVGQRELASRLGIDAVTAGQLVERHVARGLVDRQIDPIDRRARVLTLTRRGAKLCQSLRPPLRRATDRIMAPLSASERESLIDLLTRVIEANEHYARPGHGRKRPRSRTGRTTT